MSGEEPVVTIQVFYAVLPFSVDGFVEILDDLCACRFCCVEVRIDILDEDGQALRFAAQLRWRLRVRTRAHEHDPCITEMHLRATDRFSVTIVLRESEYLREPGDSFRNVLIDDVRQHGICRHGAIVRHAQSVSLRQGTTLPGRLS